jgi:transaldolase
MDPNGGHSARVIDEFETENVDVGALAEKLQEVGAAAFVKSWNHLMQNVAGKGATLAKVVNR